MIVSSVSHVTRAEVVAEGMTLKVDLHVRGGGAVCIHLPLGRRKEAEALAEYFNENLASFDHATA